MILGLIPARGGSKGVPKKNIRMVAGKPLIAYAIECGLKCPSIDRVVVSTDNEEIATIAKQYGAEIPFMRPVEIAADTTPMLPVLQHAVQEIEQESNEKVEFIVLIDSTAPLRIPDDIEQALTICKQEDCDAVISVNEAHRNPYFNMVKEENGYARLVCEPDRPVGRRQDAPVVYDVNTVVWIWKRHALMEEQARIPKRTKLYLVPRERSIDIDTEFDFQILEYYFTRAKQT